MIYTPNLITYGSIIPNDVCYVILYFTLSRGRKHCSTFHGVLIETFRPDSNESGSATGLKHNLQIKISLHLAMHDKQM